MKLRFLTTVNCFMKNKCASCKKARYHLTVLFSISVIINAFMRFLFGFEASSVSDLLFLPSLLVFLAALIIKFKLLKN